MKALAFCVLSSLVSMAAHSGTPEVLVGASGGFLSAAPAAPPSSPDRPAGGAVRDKPPAGPWIPNPTPRPAPAPTNHYAGMPDIPSAPQPYDTLLLDAR